MTTKLPELNYLIIQWAKARCIIPNATIAAQMGKTLEEASELLIGIGAEDIDKVKDGIGDIYVTLVIQAELNGITPENMEEAIKKTDCYTHKKMCDIGQFFIILELIYGLGKLMLATEGPLINIKRCIARDIYKTNYQLNVLAEMYDTTLTECVEIAYNEIKDRKGRLDKSGIFIKEQ